jgi:hypothetical protein
LDIQLSVRYKTVNSHHKHLWCARVHKHNHIK